MKRWEYALITIGLCAMSFTYGYSKQPDVKPQTIFVRAAAAIPVAENESVPLSGCAAMPMPKVKPHPIKISALIRGTL